MNDRRVLGTGPLKDCKIAIIGEAPGAQEAALNKPFIGPAGMLLDKLLPKAGIVRSACYIDNVVQVKPPNNDIKSFLDTSKKSVFKSKEYEDGIESLRCTLHECPANVIIALGNTPLYALTGKTGITKWRGSILESSLLGGRKVIPTIHPAAALREYIWERVITYDLIRAGRESSYPEIRRPICELEIFPSYDRTINYLDSVLYSSLSVAVDIEVIGYEIKCISFSTKQGHGISIPFYTEGRDYFTPSQEIEIWRRIGTIIEAKSITKIFQNGMFDLTFIYERYGIVPCNLDDTMVAHAILFPDYRHGLDFLTSVYTDHPYYKDEGKQWNKLFIDEKQFAEYSARDSLVCFEIMPKLLDELKLQNNLDTYKRQLALTNPLMYMQSKGIRLDLEGIEKAKVETDASIKQLTGELHLLAGCELNPQSPKQLQTYFYIKKGYQPYTYQGRPTTDEMAMRRLARKGAPEARIIMDIRGKAKMLGTYLDVVLDKDNRMRGSFRISGTANGRISSGKSIFGTGGNLQNQPPEMVKYFLADPRQLIVHIDLSQAENRIVAVIAAEPQMMKAFSEGKDVHSLTASLISGLSVEEVISQHKEGRKVDIGNGELTWRDWGKKCNHGLNYGLGYKKFALMFEMQESEAKRLVEAYHHAYPFIRYGFHEYVQHQLKQSRTLQNPFGRSRKFLDRWGDELFKEAYAFIPQSTVPDKMWVDGIIPIYENQSVYKDISLMNTVHDSLDFQIPVDLTSEKQSLIIDSIISRLEFPITWRTTEIQIPCDISIGYRLGKDSMIKLPHRYRQRISPLVIRAAKEQLAEIGG